MIPKIIHYCWFGGKPLPEEAQKCINSWKKYCPDYEIIEWNESNYNLHKNEYVELAYKNKKYAFLTDYVRLDVVYNNGGIYLDTDVELIKNLDDLLNYNAFFGMEACNRVNTGLGFGAEKYNTIVNENKQFYEENSFLDKNDNFKKVICVDITTSILKKYKYTGENKIQKLDNNIIVFSTEYFCPKEMGTNKINITNNTVSIHHYESSWKSNIKLIRRIGYYLIPIKSKIKKFLKIK